MSSFKKPLKIPVFEHLDSLSKSELIFYEEIWAAEKEKGQTEGASEKHSMLVNEMERRMNLVNDLELYTWEDVKDATNILYTKFFDDSVEDYVGTLCNNSLSHPMVQVLAFVGVYMPEGSDVNNEIKLLRKAYKQMQRERKIGY